MFVIIRICLALTNLITNLLAA